MTRSKKALTAGIVIAVAAALGVTGFILWGKKDDAAKKGTVYVQKVSYLNTAQDFSLSGCKFSGVVETQKTEDVKYDTTKTIAEFYVKVGDTVKKDQKLFRYDVEAMQLEYDQAKIEIERMQNEVETNNLQIEQLEKEKETAGQEDKVEITMKILSLQSDVSKAEYDIKTKKKENKTLKESINNADVLSPIDGTVKSLAETGTSGDEEDTADSGIAVSLSKGDDMQIRASVNEQMIDMVYADMPVILVSRIDSNDTWKGTITSIETKPQSGGGEMYDDMGMEEDTTSVSSKYSFYIMPENFDGLMLGQHLIVEPDLGIDDSVGEKSGIWLYSDFIIEENGKAYVWAADDKNRIEKREVKLGKTDENFGDTEIVDGLTEKDCIAYPSDQYEEGMSVTKDADKATVGEQTGGGEDEGGEFVDDEFVDDEFTDDEFVEDEELYEDPDANAAEEE